MTVWEIVKQFTSDMFFLHVYDTLTDTEIYSGYACDVQYDPTGDLLVVSIEPPDTINTITLNVDSSITDDVIYIETTIFEED